MPASCPSQPPLILLRCRNRKIPSRRRGFVPLKPYFPAYRNAPDTRHADNENSYAGRRHGTRKKPCVQEESPGQRLTDPRHAVGKHTGRHRSPIRRKRIAGAFVRGTAFKAPHLRSQRLPECCRNSCGNLGFGELQIEKRHRNHGFARAGEFLRDAKEIGLSSRSRCLDPR
jgi:hypothetical protein